MKRIPKKIPIIKSPDNILRFISKEIEIFNKDLEELSEDMLETMYQAGGVGLAAIQINKPICLIVIDMFYQIKKTPFKKLFLNKKPVIMINPKIIEESGVQYYKEGCLSVPNRFETIQRANIIKVKYQDLNGKEIVINAKGKLAVIIAHELDHLNGNLFTDKIYNSKEGSND